MRTVICHFYNEEYLLPWWLRHHREIFDYGVLIDNGSTDRSVEICRALVPDWRLVRGRNLQLEAIPQDFEVMQYESELPGWKMVLNVTEFLHAPGLKQMELDIMSAEQQGCMVDAMIMVDPFPEQIPDHALPLISQKHHGYIERDLPQEFIPSNFRWRFYHRMQIGAYTVGRHNTLWPRVGRAGDRAALVWYGFSPWRPEVIQRKLQIKSTIPEREWRMGFSVHHRTELEGLELQRMGYLQHTRDLSETLGLGRAPGQS